MKDLKNIFTIAAALVAAVPGFSLLSGNLQILPGVSRMLYGGVLEALSIMIFLIIWLYKDRIERWSRPKAIRLSIVLISFFLIFLMLYIYLYELVVHGSVVFPLWPSGDLQRAYVKYGNWDLVMTNYSPDGVTMLFQNSGTSLITTKLRFLILFQMPMILLVAAFSVLGINLRQAT
jgi:hypothetical protein